MNPPRTVSSHISSLTKSQALHQSIAYCIVLLSGVSYATYIGGALWYLSGTSASTPVIAAMISNINASRRKNGKGSVGWLNPALYKYASEFINDVTVGHNKCVAGGAVCCRTGFYATAGWDPTTGTL